MGVQAKNLSSYTHTIDSLKSALGFMVNGYLILPNTVTGMNVRIGQRTGFVYAIDQELTATGFDGIESIDGGITGDWINVGGQAQE